MRPAALMRGASWKPIWWAVIFLRSVREISASAFRPKFFVFCKTTRPYFTKVLFSPSRGHISATVATATRSKNHFSKPRGSGVILACWLMISDWWLLTGPTPPRPPLSKGGKMTGDDDPISKPREREVISDFSVCKPGDPSPPSEGDPAKRDECRLRSSLGMTEDVWGKIDWYFFLDFSERMACASLKATPQPESSENG